MLRRILQASAALALVACTAVSARPLSRCFIFPGCDAAPREVPPEVVRHELVASDGVPVHALELPASSGARTIVYFHNNRDTADTRLDVARDLHARGYGVLLLEYRGYGAASDAEPSEAGLYQDAAAVLDMLDARGIGPDRIVLWGTSLGTGVAAEMARRGRGQRLVLETPYTSLPDLVTDAAPFVPARRLLADHFDTLSKAGEIGVPTLVIHGDEDEIVPFWMGARVASAVPDGRLVRVAGGRHGDLFERDREWLVGEIAVFSM